MIDTLKSVMRQMPQAELRTEHYFADGMYIRAVYRAAGTTIVGKVHKKEHFYVVAAGTVLVVSNGERKTLTAPQIIVCAPGTQKAVYAVTDALCFTVHRTNETDLDKIEAEVVEPDDTALFDARNEIKRISSV